MKIVLLLTRIMPTVFVPFVLCLSLTVLVDLKPLKAADFFVSPFGDNANPGTRKKPWRTMSEACLRLSPGDTLFVRPGWYRDEARIFIRKVDPITFGYSPLEGTKKSPVKIVATGRGPHVIEGYFDVRGSFITIRGLTVLGNPDLETAGIGMFESHNVTIRDCVVSNHGASGIQFAQCDLMSAIGNITAFNATKSPAQTSGISSYQAMVRTDSDEKTGLTIRDNITFCNQNLVPNSDGDITDGNGIIVDDHNYTQFNGMIDAAVNGVPRNDTAGIARIGLDDDGVRIPYKRKTRISNNICYLNGGKGIHLYRTDNVKVDHNLCFGNLLSPAFTTELPRDKDGVPFYINGELSVVESQFVTVHRNVAIACGAERAAAAEIFFITDLPDGKSPNKWTRNTFVNFGRGPNVFTFGSEESSLNR